MNIIEPGIRNLATAKDILLTPYGLDESLHHAHARRDLHAQGRLRRPLLPVTRAAKRGASKKASSSRAASASTRASACAPCRASARRSPIPTTSRPRRSARRRIATRAIAKAGGGKQQDQGRPVADRRRPAATCTCRPIRSHSLDATAKVKLLERVEKMARGRDPRIVAGDGGPRRRIRRRAGRAQRRRAGRRRAAARARVGHGDRRAERPPRNRQRRRRRPLRLRLFHRRSAVGLRRRRGARRRSSTSTRVRLRPAR